MRRFNFNNLLSDDHTLHEMLLDVKVLGIALVENAPLKLGQVKELAHKVGFLFPIIYGETFQAKLKDDASTAAFLSCDLPFHTDAAYNSIRPGIQMLHCLQQSDQGGENIIVDGFKVANELRETSPDSYDVLTKQVLEFYDRGTDSLGEFFNISRNHVIRLNEKSEVAQITFTEHGRSAIARMPADDVIRIYKALSSFSDLLYAPENVFEYKMKNGLSAAKLLHESGQDVLILEANDRVGGRTLNFHDEAIKYAELGGAYMGPTQDRLYRLSKELGIDNFHVEDDGEAISYNRGIWRYLSGQYPATLNPLFYMDLNHFYHIIDEMGEKIPMDRPWDFPEAEEWDNMTVKEWCDKTFWFQLTKDSVAVHCCNGLCCEASDLSLLYFLWYIKGCCGYLRYSCTINGAQERKFRGGSQRISLAIAEQLGEDRVLLNNPVSRLVQNGEGVTVTTLDGNSYKAKYVIAALPPAMLTKINFTPNLPALRNQLNQRYPMGAVIKTTIYYERPFWKDSGFSGAVLADGIISEIRYDGRVSLENRHALVGFMSGDGAKDHCHLTKEERRDLIAQRYATFFKTDEALKHVYYVEKNWMEEPYIGGGYVGYTPPGVITKYCRVIREPIGRLYFAGTETATKWSGYMDGAVQAGERAAREILYTVGKINKDEIWQEEPEAQDMPARPFEEPFLKKHLPSLSGFLRCVGATFLLTAVGGTMWMKREALQTSVHLGVQQVSKLLQ